MFYNKNDPLIDSVKKVMEQNEKERRAAAAVNEKLGITDRRALPHDRQHEWDAAYKKVLTEGVEALDEISKKTLTSYVKKATDDYTVKWIGQRFGTPPEELEKRKKGLDRARDRLKGTIMVKKKYLAKEETEQLDEISSKLAANYLKKRFERDYETKDGTTFKRKKSLDFPKESDKVHKNTVRALKRIKEEDELEEGLMMNDYGHTKEIMKKKKLAKILKRRMGKGDGKESVEQSRREDK